jgi:hypothetical protein
MVQWPNDVGIDQFDKGSTWAASRSRTDDVTCDFGMS